MKKEILMKAFEEAKRKCELVVLNIHMFNGQRQTIQSRDIEEMMKYVDSTYDENLAHVNCSQIHIDNYVFMMKDYAGSFGDAIVWLKSGLKVARKGWNGKGMFLYYVPEASYSPCTPIGEECATDNGKVPYGAYIAMKTAQGNVVPWLASQTDMLSDDWCIVE